MATTLMPLDPATSPQRAVRVLPISANLLPDEVIAGRRAKKVRGWVIIVLGVVTVLLGSWYAIVVLQARNAQDDLRGVSVEEQVLKRKQTEFSDVTNVRKETSTIEAQLAGLLAEDLRWSTVLDTLRSTGTESAIQVTAVTGALNSSQAGGAAPADRLPTAGADKVIGTMTVSGNAPDKNSVARYVDALGKVDKFANVFLTSAAESTSSEASGQVQFSLSVDITVAALGGRFSPTPAPTPAASATTTPGGN
jgi:Tfp pilus assembly protein PilN